MTAINDAHMLAQDLALGCNNKSLGINAKADSLSANGSSLLGRSGIVKAGSNVPARKYFEIVLRDSPVRRLISRIDCFSRNAIRRMMFKSPIWITPLPPSLTAMGEGSHGSILNGNHAPNRLSSAWKPTV